MASQKTGSLRETNPVKYYKRKKRWLGFAKFLCNLLPPLAVLITYAVCSCLGGAFTNPLVPWRFGLGIVVLVVATVFIVVHELRAITRANKETGEGAIFTSSIVWLFIATILWLFYLTMFYLIILCFAEFLGNFFGAFCTSGIKNCNQLILKNKDAELTARAAIRVQKEEIAKTGVPIE